MKTNAVLPLAASILLLGGCPYVQAVSAQEDYNSRCIVLPRAHGFRLDVLVDGVPLNQIHHGSRTYVEAPWDKDFDIRISCPYGSRYLAVCSVDGLSIMTGKTAASSDDGYVIEGGTVTIPGFRLTSDNVAHFHFGDKSKSYAKLIGKPTNIGVIGLKIFADANRRQHVYHRNLYDYKSNPAGLPPLAQAPSSGGADDSELQSFKKSQLESQNSIADQARANSANEPTAKPFSGKDAARGSLLRNSSVSSAGGIASCLPPPPTQNPLDHDMGTEFGARTEFLTHDVEFARGAQVASFAIEYASHEKLVQAGIIPGESSPVHPNPFPADNSGCTPPPGWRG